MTISLEPTTIILEAGEPTTVELAASPSPTTADIDALIAAALAGYTPGGASQPVASGFDVWFEPDPLNARIHNRGTAGGPDGALHDDNHDGTDRDLTVSGNPLGSPVVGGGTAYAFKPGTNDDDPPGSTYYDGVWTAGRDFAAVGGISVQVRSAAIGDAEWTPGGVEQHVVAVMADSAGVGQLYAAIALDGASRGKIRFGFADASGAGFGGDYGPTGRIDWTAEHSLWVQAYNDGGNRTIRIRHRYLDSGTWHLIYEFTEAGAFDFAPASHPFRIGHGRGRYHSLHQLNPLTDAVLCGWTADQLPTSGDFTDAYGVVWHVASGCAVYPAAHAPVWLATPSAWPVFPDLDQWSPSPTGGWTFHGDIVIDDRGFEGRGNPTGVDFMGTSGDGWAAMDGTAGGVGFAVFVNTTNSYAYVPNLPMTLGQRHRLTIIVDEKQDLLIVWVDGVWAGQAAITGPRVRPTSPGPWVARQPGIADTSRMEVGRRLATDRVLSTAEVIQLRQELPL